VSGGLGGDQSRVKQLAQAWSFAGATLPDDNKLSEDNWAAEFEEWRKKQEERAEAERDDDDGEDRDDDWGGEDDD
jgi:hypothetical protein